MKKFLLFLLFPLLLAGSASAQQNGCAGAIDINYWGYLSFYNQPPTPADASINYGCIPSAGTVFWYGYFRVCTGGTLFASIYSNSFDEVDAVVWGPFSSANNMCAQLTAGNVAGCSVAQNWMWDSVNVGNVNAGEYYMIAVAKADSTAYPEVSFGGTALVDQSCAATCHPISNIETVCLVTVDSLTQKYKIMWEKQAPNPVSYFGVNKIGINNQVIQVDTVNYSSLSEYIDMSSNPNVMTEQYFIETFDTCGGSWTSGAAAFVQPVFCQSSLSTQNTVNLNWTNYIDNANLLTPQYFVIYRGSTAALMPPLDTVPAFVQNYTDVNPLAGISYYKIGVALPGTCVPTHMVTPTVQSFSNNSTVTVTGLAENNLAGLAIFPNPADEQVTLSGLPETSALIVTDPAGRIVMRGLLPASERQEIDLSALESGLYLVEIVNEKGFFRKEIIVQH